MFQTKIEHMKKNPPFLLKKEKNNRIQGQRGKLSINSLNNTNIIKINSHINLDSTCKDKNINQIKEESNKTLSMESEVKFSMGRWTKEEHNKFLKGIIEYGNNWKMVERLIKTRSSSQARSHAQKYFVKVKKKIKRQNKVFNAQNLINYFFNCIKNFKGGKPLDAIQKKRTLNLLISNFQNFRKDEIESCNMMINETKNINSKKDGDKFTFYEKKNNKNTVSEKNDIMTEIKENNYLNNNSDLENKNNTGENKIEFCNKKRKNSLISNKIFEINKVSKYKYSNNINNNNITNISNNCTNLISIKNANDNDNKKVNINLNNNMKSWLNNNFNNNNDITSLDMNKFNFSDSLFDLSLRKNNNFGEDEYPKYNTFESHKKLFGDGNELNDSFKNNFFEESILSLGEQIDENSLINKLYDLFE